jgi:hypothetical protein
MYLFVQPPRALGGVKNRFKVLQGKNKTKL